MSAIKKDFAAKLLDSLVEYDQQMSSAYYEMGRILHAISQDKLWDMLGYESMAHLVESELSFTPTTAAKYANTYRLFKQFGYQKAEALNLILDHSYTQLANILPGIKQKLGTRALGKRIRTYMEENHQVNFQLNKKEYDMLVKKLTDHGAIFDKGKLRHASAALVEVLQLINDTKTKRAA